MCISCELKSKDTMREDFCPSCLVVPLAVAGAGAAGISMTSSKKHKLQKKILLISAIISILLSISIGLYYLVFKKDCESCKVKL